MQIVLRMTAMPREGIPTRPKGWLRTRHGVVAFLVAHGLVVWGAFLLRVDRFPLSWAPMYTVLREGPVLSVPVWDRTATLLATRRDGATEALDADALNIPSLSFWRLYYKRMVGRGPAKHDHERVDEPWNRSVRHALSLDTHAEVRWDRRVLESINRTLGRDVDAPDFIICVQARAEHLRFERGVEARFERADIVSVYRWDESWSSKAARP